MGILDRLLGVNETSGPPSVTADTAESGSQASDVGMPQGEQLAREVGQIVENLNPESKVREVYEHMTDLAGQYQVRLRELEEFGWDMISQANLNVPGIGIDHNTRKTRNEAAERVWKEDPTAGRAVTTINEYVWGRGLPTPRASDRRVQRLIRSIWEDDDNRLTITTYEAQVRKGTDLTLFGELFLVVFEDGTWTEEELDPPLMVDTSKMEDLPPEKDRFNSPLLPPSENPSLGGTPPIPQVDLEDDEALYSPYLRAERREPPPPASAIKIGQIHPNEIIDIVPDEDRSDRPRYYKRVFRTRKYDFSEDKWSINTGVVGSQASEARVKYYEDLVYEPAEGQDAPPENKIGEGKILHVAINRTSFDLRGNSEVWRAVRWAKALTDFFTWRLTLLRALATFAYRKKTKGGSSQVLKAASSFMAGSGYTGIPGQFDPVAPPATGSILTENQNESLEQFKTSSGAGEAEQDAQMLRGQVGVALGLPIHYLGDKGATSLAGAQAMELPVLKAIEARQELFEQLFTKLINRAIDKAIADGALPADVDRSFYVEMPPILQRNVPEMVASITNTIARLDPFATDVRLKRLALHKVLSWLGEPDPESIIRDIYPPGSENKPEEPVVPGAPAGTPGGPPAPTGDTPLGAPVGAPVNPATGAPTSSDLGATGAFAGPEQLTSRQPYPGARSGVTFNQNGALGG